MRRNRRISLMWCEEISRYTYALERIYRDKFFNGLSKLRCWFARIQSQKRTEKKGNQKDSSLQSFLCVLALWNLAYNKLSGMTSICMIQQTLLRMRSTMLTPVHRQIYVKSSSLIIKWSVNFIPYGSTFKKGWNNKQCLYLVLWYLKLIEWRHSRVG